MGYDKSSWLPQVVVLGALLLAGCGGTDPAVIISGATCSARTTDQHSDRLASAAALLEKAKGRQDPASIAFGRRLREFGRALVQHTSGPVPTVAEYMAAFELTLVNWERERGVDVQEARRRARGQIVQSLPVSLGNGLGDDRLRSLRDSLFAFEGVRRYVEENGYATDGVTRLLQGSRLKVDTVAFFSDIEALAIAVADTTRVGSATLSESQAQYSLRAPSWTDTTRLRQLGDVHTVFDTLRLFLDDVAFAAWLADTSNLTPVWSMGSSSCERDAVAPLTFSRAQACPPCWAVAVAVARVGGAGALAGAIWEIGKGILTGQGGDTGDIVEAAAVGAAGGVAAMGLGALLVSQYSVFGWGAIGAAIASYFYMN